jgi:hypothetical protein
MFESVEKKRKWMSPRLAVWFGLINAGLFGFLLGTAVVSRKWQTDPFFPWPTLVVGFGVVIYCGVAASRGLTGKDVQE